ncbi:MAG: four helix bundle protein [Bacteroidota bacterium]
MPEEKNKKYDLEERTFLFAQAVRKFIKQLPRTISNIEDCKQLTRASGSVGANYIEANESLGKKDFLMHIKICRKESKESKFFLRLVDTDKEFLEKQRTELIQEAMELMLIFGSILSKSKSNED